MKRHHSFRYVNIEEDIGMQHCMIQNDSFIACFSVVVFLLKFFVGQLEFYLPNSDIYPQ